MARRNNLQWRLPSSPGTVGQKAMAFRKEIKIHFNDADPAGICFFATVFTKVHQVFESFIEEHLESSKDWFLNSEVVAPIRQTEADFLKPLRALESYEVEVTPISVSESTFRLQFEVLKGSTTHCKVITTHTCIHTKKMEKAPLPKPLSQALSALL